MTIQTSAADNGRLGKKNVGAILFACNINAVRSAMAEAMVKVTFPREIFVDSCGVAPGNPDGFAIAVMAEIGIDMGRINPNLLMISIPNFTMSSFPSRPKHMLPRLS